MANHLINITENGTTTLATSGKYCDRDVDIIVEVAGSGGGGEGGVPEELLVITGDCQYRFAYAGWNWVINKYGNQITTTDIGNSSNMFYTTSYLEIIPFDFNYADTSVNVSNMFYSCGFLKEISGAINNLKPSTMSNMFMYCEQLRYLPEFNGFDTSNISSGCRFNMFNGCYSLRRIEPSFLKQLKNNKLTNDYCAPYSTLKTLYNIDELVEVPVVLSALTSNRCGNLGGYCYRLKELIFETNDDGSAIATAWKSQTINLSSYTGYAQDGYGDYITSTYNSGITTDKEVYDDTTYQTLKNDPDWFTLDVAYSRYNHDSAVRTINSLPDTTSGGGVNTIKFNGAAGSATDGGAINTLTEEEIAVAAAKGWTVSIT